MGCFSCSKDKSELEINILQKYKEYFEKTGKGYWFYKHLESKEVSVISEEDFKKFKNANKKDFAKGLYEFSHIREFRDS